MVFTNLGPSEKAAFFSLLDEYFQSRPEILQRTGESTSNFSSSVSHLSKSFGDTLSNFKKTPHTAGAPSTTPTHKSQSSIEALQSSQRLGHIDTSSKTSALFSLHNKNKDASASSQAHIPPALPAQKRSFAPPPTRSAAPTFAPKHTPEPEPEPEPEQERGQWAEALYDYESSEPGDLQIKENQRILVVEQTTGDWWTGEVDGRRGLFPATYVKLL